MKKKKFLFFILFLTAVFSLAACGVKTETRDGGDGGNSEEYSVSVEPEEQPDLSGLIKTVTGNEVVIMKIDMGEQGENMAAGMAGQEIDADQVNNQRAAGTGLASALSGGMTGGPGGGTPPAGGGPGGGGPEGDNSEESRTSMIEKFKEMSTGEETVIVPVGIPILKRQSGGKEAGTVEAVFSDIKAETMVRIWLDADATDKKVASFVLIIN